jgi:hypothetical protein
MDCIALARTHTATQSVRPYSAENRLSEKVSREPPEEEQKHLYVLALAREGRQPGKASNPRLPRDRPRPWPRAGVLSFYHVRWKGRPGKPSGPAIPSDGWPVIASAFGHHLNILA